MTTLSHFLPHHFTSSSSSSSSYSSHPFSHQPHESYASTASDSSSSPTAFSTPSPSLHKRHHSLSLPTPNALAALLPSPPGLARQSSKDPPPPPPSSSFHHHPPRPLYVNTSLPPPLLHGISTSSPSSPSSSSTPLMSSSLPPVSSITLNPSSRAFHSQPSTPVGRDHPPPLPTYRVEVHDAHAGVGAMTEPRMADVLPASHPPSPVLPLRRVPDVTPPPSPTAASPDTFPPAPAAVHAPSTPLSSALALSFPAEPSLPELLASISMVLHVQLIKDRTSPLQAQLRLPEFREEGAAGGAAAGVPGAVPSVRSIYQFLLHVFQRGKFSSELGLLSLVYVHRVMASTGVSLTAVNYRPLLMSALCLAQKMWDDTPLINGDFRILYPQLLPGADKQSFLAKFNRLEAAMCEALHFNCLVTSETYQLYLGELQAIWTEYEHGQHTHTQDAAQTHTQLQQTSTGGAASTPAPALLAPPVTACKSEAVARRSPSPMKVEHAKAQHHRHHPYAGPAVSERRLHGIKAVQAMDCGSDAEWSDGDGSSHLPGGWDPTILALPAAGAAPMAH